MQTCILHRRVNSFLAETVGRLPGSAIWCLVLPKCSTPSPKGCDCKGNFFVCVILAWDCKHKVHLHNNSISSGPLPERPDVRSITNDPLSNLIVQSQGNSIQVCHFRTTFSAQHPLCSHTTTLSCYFCLTWLIAKVSADL